MNAEDQKAVEGARENGAGVLHNVLTGEELDAARREFDRAHLDLDMGPGEPGSRDSLRSEPLLKYPALARLFCHPRIVGVVSAILEDPKPWLQKMKTNRYTPEHPGCGRHSDGVLEALAPPFNQLSTQVFLDNITVESGAVTYVPGSHLRLFESPDDPDRKPPIQEEINAGDYIPIQLQAGGVIFRVPEVWHAVNPIHHLRRYVTGNYVTRSQLTPPRTDQIANAIENWKKISLEEIPKEVRECWQC